MKIVSQILVIEDHDVVRGQIAQALGLSGFEVTLAKDGREGMLKALKQEYDLILLDSIMPYFSGWDILAQLKKQRPSQEVILMIAKNEDITDRVKAIRGGADECIQKPFKLGYMLDKVQGIIKAKNHFKQHSIELIFPQGTVNFSTHKINYSDGSTVDLSEREGDLLSYLSRNQGRVVEREEILRKVWRINPNDIITRTIDMHIANLRQKLRDPDQKTLSTVWGRGYMVKG